MCREPVQTAVGEKQGAFNAFVEPANTNVRGTKLSGGFTTGVILYLV